MRRTSLVAASLAALTLAGCTTDPKPAATATASAEAKAPAVDYAAWDAGRSTPVADPLYPEHGNPQLDVLHYGLELAWEPTTRTLTGTATLGVRPLADLTEIRLDFAAYTLDATTVDGKPQAGSVAGAKFAVPATLTKDKPVTLVVKYHGTPATVRMPSHRGDAEGLGLTVTADNELWTMQEPFGAYTWYPANDQPSDRALYDISVTAPEGWAAIASGTPGERKGNTYTYGSKDPVASYLTTLAVGRYQKESVVGPHGLPLTYWFKPGADEGMLSVIRKSPTYIEWLEKKFGAYPFPSAGVVLVPSESGMETQQMITIGIPKVADKSRLPAVMDGDMLHEYAHQWFGDAVTTSNWNDLWLNEGWAMYAQLLWEDERDHVTDEQLETWLRKRDADLRARLGAPGHPKADSFAESNVYLCPAGMLHEIHQAVGDERFYAMARDWIARNKGTQDRASFTAFVNKHTGQDFTALIDAWLDSPTTPA
ncbi:metallopeptidase [Longispora fulva]|uniref:Aminopeptidase N n=1 Tax=Longispora fulva TaxID=619741 RepID=A0A8J7GM02_9ACTN|nr:M1 family metallopeptidase [Longispora fulva]MBG6140741.1 aminopeptidase N [Longispora fulva]GIG60995.1 metallopeptidase [Longispora fulva]